MTTNKGKWSTAFVVDVEMAVSVIYPFQQQRILYRETRLLYANKLDF